jgi:chromosome segregation protein
MISRLKSLELQGYKTFANRTVFEFPGAVTAIVGPNGSGKSNITDALRWVLGEQSYSLLRGKKTEDMIFAGSEIRTRSGMATATVILDNSDNWLPIDYTEVAIARRAYRDGSNEYLLNGQRVRLKDVSELLSESGLAERTYTIIGQGLVDAALALRAEDRRRLFEEAAGIGLHRTRRSEAVRRLETTHRNLERVEVILTEIRPRLRSLERQARRAQDYEQAVNDLRSLLKQWYGYHWHQAQEELTHTQKQAKELEGVLEESRSRQSQIENDVSNLRGKRQELREELSGLHRQSSDLHSQRESINHELVIVEERERYLHEQENNYRIDLTQTEEEVGLLREQVKYGIEEINRLEAELSEAKENALELQDHSENRLKERNELENKLEISRGISVEVISHFAELNARHAERLNQINALEGTKISAEKAIVDGKEHLDKSVKKVDKRMGEVQETEEKFIQTQNELDAIRQEILDEDTKRQELLRELHQLETEVAKYKTQLEVIEQAKSSYASYSDGARLLIEAAQDLRLEGSHGLLGDKLGVPEQFEVAIGAVLGEYIEAIVLKDTSGIDSALNVLDNSPEKAAILPLDTIAPHIERINFPQDENVFGIAKDLVTASDELIPVINLLLGNTVVVQNRGVASELLANFRKLTDKNSIPDWRIVTLNGEVFYARGPIKTSSKNKHASFSQKREGQKIQKGMQRSEKELADVADQIRQIDINLKTLRETEERIHIRSRKDKESHEKAQSAHRQEYLNVEQIRRELIWREDRSDQIEIELINGQDDIEEITQELAVIEKQENEIKQELKNLSEELDLIPVDDIQADLAHWTTRVAVLEQALQETYARQTDRKQELEQEIRKSEHINESVSELVADGQELATNIVELHKSETKINEDIEEMRELIVSGEEKIESNENLLIQLQSHESKERGTANQSEHNFSQTRITLVRKQEALEAIRRQIEADFGLVDYEYLENVTGPTPLPLEGLVEDLPFVKELSLETEEDLKRQRALLRRIGPINPEAMKEYQEVHDRYDFLSSQVADLQSAVEDVRRVISELDEIMEREFCKTYEAVAEEFHQIFGRLFGGGSARLVLTDPDDLTDTGIDIEARLPGRREQGLSLLSGGERSLTAVALVFSLLRVSPTPFCVLDEVDAMLDEANVGRFRELLRELSLSTQFILITHNRATVQVADIIYGVTMGRDSTSQILSLKVDELEKVV